MSIPFSDIGNIPVDTSVLTSMLNDYQSPKDRIQRYVRAGILLRLKKGLFVISPEITRNDISIELIANHLYGPSYISFQSALSYYGLIPERVYITLSATANRKKIYKTSFGIFEFITVPESYFPIGVKTKIVNNKLAFLIASPEKALCDLILSTSGLRFQSLKSVHEFLHHDLRLDIDLVINWDVTIMEECITHAYKKNDLKLLIKYFRSEYGI